MFTKVIVALYALGFTAVMAGAQPSNVPGCVSKCWDNTQYVSTCAGETKCLCDDAEFQNAVFQCLYSQCPTALFGSALHHTLSVCSDDETKEDQPAAPASTAPALLRQQPARKAKRNLPYQSVTASVTASARITNTRTMSVNFPTSTAPVYGGGGYGGNPWAPVQPPARGGNPWAPVPAPVQPPARGGNPWAAAPAPVQPPARGGNPWAAAPAQAASHGGKAPEPVAAQPVSHGGKAPQPVAAQPGHRGYKA